MPSETRAFTPPRVGAWLVITSLCALLMFAYHYLDDVASGDPPRFAKAFIEETTGVFASASLFLFVRRVARRYPLSRATWRRAVPAHLGALLLFGVTATTLNWASRTLLYWMTGLGLYDYGIMRFRYLMEFPLQTIGYTLMVSAVWLFDRAQADREAALRAAQLESQLRQAQLQELRLQLQPHFLFNALNTISSTMYEDPGAADAMIARLAELLRVSLRTTRMQEVPLAAELEALGHYVALLRARFGDRLRIAIEVDETLRPALVPSLVLQPLVENAVRHGNLSRIGAGCIDVRARCEGERLVLTVEDDGPGPEPDTLAAIAERLEHAGSGTRGEERARGIWRAARPWTAAERQAEARAEVAGVGVGLHATRERLRLLHGDAARLTLHTAPGRRSFRVELTLPLRVVSHEAGRAGAPAGNGAPRSAAAHAMSFGADSLPGGLPTATADANAPADAGRAERAIVRGSR